MKIAVFGATGRTGTPFIEQALAAGHEIKALVRSPAKMTRQNPGLQLIQGDAMDAGKVEETIAGTDAVVSMLGHTRNTPPNMQETAMRHIITAMKKQGVRRLVSLTGAGVGDPKDQPKLVNHIIRFLLKTLSPAVLKDGENQAALIRQSELDWVIVRGPMLTEGPYTGKYRVGYVGVNTGARISRADVADFMLRQLTEDTYLHDAPMISD